eukprot:TRINITY_DN11257_c0_g1_i1.p1 TRINITY_DN11257_c0_g1~~TRINITY_DN11257_c0_g1_i1.p1  ORF type:complete len:126 (-),score=16.36 TRINITY_DN11257_c0_g1_i1:457-834(-)
MVLLFLGLGVDKGCLGQACPHVMIAQLSRPFAQQVDHHGGLAAHVRVLERSACLVWIIDARSFNQQRSDNGNMTVCSCLVKSSVANRCLPIHIGAVRDQEIDTFKRTRSCCQMEWRRVELLDNDY